MTKFPDSIEEIAKEIDIPVQNWPGNCHGIATEILKLMPIEGMRLCRGHWNGYISKESVYRNRSIQQHSWLELEDGRILDPTRWAIVSPNKPHLYVGVNDHYDEFGLHLKKKSYFPTLGKVEYPFLKNLQTLSSDDFELLFQDAKIPDTENGWQNICYKFDDILKSEPWSIDNVEEKYLVIQKIGLKAFIQIDMWNAVIDQEKVFVNPFSNRFYEAPENEGISDARKLFMILNRFLCIEDREYIEEELEEFGYSLEKDLWESLNTMDSFTRNMPEMTIENLPNINGMIDVLSVISSELLGKGYGKELEVERYARSIGIRNKDELNNLLETFGNRCNYDLRWY